MARARNRDLEQRILETCRQACRRIGIVGGRYIIGVSGGPDSLALADILKRLSAELNLELVISYVDHGLRGIRASRAERRAVSRFADRTETLLDIRELAMNTESLHRDGLEAGARSGRYEKLFQSVREHGADALVLAHHQLDQVETVLMRLVSGTTVDGAAGMREWSVRNGIPILRPLLAVDGRDLRRYARLRRLRPVFDRTNRDRRRLRSRIRRDLLPAVERIRPKSLEAIARTAVSMAEESDALDQALAYLNPFHAMSGYAMYYEADRSEFFGLSPALRLRALHGVAATVTQSSDYRIPRRFFHPLLGDDTFARTKRVAVGYGIEVRLDEERLLVHRPHVVSAAKPHRILLVDPEGTLVVNMVPEPLNDLTVCRLDGHKAQRENLSIGFARENPSIDFPREACAVSDDGDRQGFRQSYGTIRVPCVPPVHAHTASPNDGTALGFKRSSFKRMLQRKGRFGMVLTDGGGHRLLFIREKNQTTVFLYPPWMTSDEVVLLEISSRNAMHCFQRGSNESMH